MTAAEKAQAIKDLIWDRMDIEITCDPGDVEGVTDIDTFERIVDIERAISEQSEIIYYDRAIKYLAAQDPSLHEALEIADEYGYRPKDLSSEILATLLNEQKTREIYYDLRDEIEEILQEDEDEDEEDIEGCGIITYLAPARGQKSFYDKAVVDDQGDFMVLYSYGTPVVQWDKEKELFYIMPNNKYAPNGKYSATTTKHIRAFADHLGVNVGKATVGVY